MAIYNEILAPRYARMLQKLFGIKGTVPAKQLAGEIMPVFSIFQGVENRYLEAWNRYAFRFSIAAAVGFNSVVRFRNPAGSSVVAVFEKISSSNNVAQNPSLEIRAVNTDLAAAGGMISTRLDARGSQTPSLVLSSQNTAVFALTTPFWSIFAGASTNTEVILTDEQEISLLPGDSLTIVENGLNTTLQGNVMWRERSLEDSEKS